MKKIHQAGAIRIKSKFLFFKKIGKRRLIVFNFVKVEQIYDGKKWLFNRMITEENVFNQVTDEKSERLLGR